MKRNVPRRIDMTGNIRDKPVVPKLNYTPEGRHLKASREYSAATHHGCFSPNTSTCHGRPPGPSEDGRSSFLSRPFRRIQNYMGKVLDDGPCNLDNEVTLGLNHTGWGLYRFNPGVRIQVEIPTGLEPRHVTSFLPGYSPRPPGEANQ